MLTTLSLDVRGGASTRLSCVNLTTHSSLYQLPSGSYHTQVSYTTHPRKNGSPMPVNFPCKNQKGAYINPSTLVENLGARLFTHLEFVHVRILGRQDSPYLRYSNARK